MYSPKLQQDGKGMFMLVRAAIPDAIEETVLGAGLTPDDIDLVITHQPSIHLLEVMQKRLAKKDLLPKSLFLICRTAIFLPAQPQKLRTEQCGKAVFIKAVKCCGYSWRRNNRICCNP